MAKCCLRGQNTNDGARTGLLMGLFTEQQLNNLLAHNGGGICHC